MATKLNLSIDQGATFRKTFRWSDSNGDPHDLTAWSARMQIRRQIKSTGDPLLELTSGDGDITLGDGLAGDTDPNVEVLITDEATGGLPDGSWKYDLELESPGGEVTRLVEGTAKVRPEVTRS